VFFAKEINNCVFVKEINNCVFAKEVNNCVFCQGSSIEVKKGKYNGFKNGFNQRASQCAAVSGQGYSR
jgi:hypothetical protein